MSKNKRTPNTNRDNVLNELLNEFDEEKNTENSGENAEYPHGENTSVIMEESRAEKNDDASSDSKAETSAAPKKHTFYFIFAVFTIIMALVGVVSAAVFAIGKISNAVSSSSLKDEYTKFLLPVVANDIAPFENENELSNSAKINCSIWNIMLNHDTSLYKLSETGEFLIPEYDVEYSCREIFGSSSGIIHRTVGSSDMSFTYNADNHVYSCSKDLRYLNYVPVITEMSQDGGTYTLTVDYYSPAVRFLSENMGIEAETEKTMKYVINRYDGKNTLVAVEFASDIVVS